MSIEELAQAAPLNPSPATVSQTVVAQQARVVYGWSFAESTGGATAKVRVRDGNNVTGRLIGIITLASGASVRDDFPVEGLAVNTGAIFVEIVSGSVEGVCYWG